MTIMEFILVTHAILIGLGVAEVLRGFADLVRAEPIRISRRLLGIAFWALLLYFEIWWAIWRIKDRDAWSFPEFLLFLLPVLILYLVARLSFPKRMDGVDLKHYYERISPVMWLLVSGVYVSFALMQPILYGSVVPPLLVSQLAIAIPALVAIRVRTLWFHFLLIMVMLLQVAWRGLLLTVGT
jgi:hypothetical protein